MKTVCTLGNSGFIGNAVSEILARSFSVNNSKEYDILVNCAGFSRMYEGSKNPEKMRSVENSIFDRITAISFDRLIHISTVYIDVYPDDIYSKIKIDMENRILNKYPNATILRLGGVVGPGLKKNVVFDLLNNKQLFVTEDSVYNYISTGEIAEIVAHIINNPQAGIINVAASSSISSHDIAAMLNKTPIYGSKKEIIYVDTSVLQKFYAVKRSDEYLTEFFKTYEY